MLLIASAISLFLGGPIFYNFLHLERFTPERTGSSKAFNIALLILLAVLVGASYGTIFFYLVRPNQMMLDICGLMVVLDCTIFLCFQPGS